MLKDDIMWHDIKDKKPKIGQYVYAKTKDDNFFNDGHVLRVRYEGDRFIYSTNGVHYAYYVSVSHWQEGSDD